MEKKITVTIELTHEEVKNLVRHLLEYDALTKLDAFSEFENKDVRFSIHSITKKVMEAVSKAGRAK